MLCFVWVVNGIDFFFVESLTKLYFFSFIALIGMSMDFQAFFGSRVFPDQLCCEVEEFRQKQHAVELNYTDVDLSSENVLLQTILC